MRKVIKVLTFVVVALLVALATMIYWSPSSAPLMTLDGQGGRRYEITRMTGFPFYDTDLKRFIKIYKVDYKSDSLDDKNALESDAVDIMKSVKTKPDIGRFDAVVIMAEKCKRVLVFNSCKTWGTVFDRAAGGGDFVRLARRQ